MSRIGQDFAMIYGRELDRLAGEIAAYRSDADLWSTTGAQKNPPGVLAMHLVGGLRAMIGAGLGKTGYVRDRDREFSERGAPREEVLRRIGDCKHIIVSILGELDDAEMGKTYPGTTPPLLKGITTQGFLMHLLWHLGWHLGQIYYHRLGITKPDEE